jgi:predicted AAA+ superfamily ATPase
MIQRFQYTTLVQAIRTNKVVLVRGSHGVGKHTAIQVALIDLGLEALFFDARNKNVQNEFNSAQLTTYKLHFHNASHVVIEHAEYLQHTQQLVDYVVGNELNITLILSCAYKPTLETDFFEALRLQAAEILLFPPTFAELASRTSIIQEDHQLATRLVYGNYAEHVLDVESAQAALQAQLNEMLVSEIGFGDRINKTNNLKKVLQALSYSIGSPVSFNEIAKWAGIDNETAERYILLLEEAHVIFCLVPFFNQKKYEISKKRVIYFVDNGIRNVLINNFNPLDMRNDTEELWKNWFISERIKWRKMKGMLDPTYFWMTHTKQTIAYIEKQDAGFTGFSPVWQNDKKMKTPALFQSYYPEIIVKTIKPKTYWNHLSRR